MTAELLSVADVARIASLSEYTVRQAVRDGDLRATKLRGRIRVHPDDLADWIDRGRVKIRPVPVGSRAPRPVVAPQPPSGGNGTPAGGYRAAARDRRRAA